MQYYVTLREMNQHFPRYVKTVEEGNEIIITRRGQPVARVSMISVKKELSAEQIKAKERLINLMKKGISLKGQSFSREDLHER